MKTEIIHGKTPQFVFPLLATFLEENEADNFTVLFTSDGVGTVVHDPNSIHGLGYYSDDWVTLAYEIWEILTPGTEVTLIQE